jgi:uncharacterized membrane protein YoaK (UPF0700 family)
VAGLTTIPHSKKSKVMEDKYQKLFVIGCGSIAALINLVRLLLGTSNDMFVFVVFVALSAAMYFDEKIETRAMATLLAAVLLLLLIDILFICIGEHPTHLQQIVIILLLAFVSLIQYVLFMPKNDSHEE